MEGLRTRQKAKRHSLIFNAATQLFSEVGYEQASIEAIAERAEVSIGTIYNYYKNKGDILLSIVATEGQKMLDIGRTIIESPDDQPRAVLQKLMKSYVEHPLEFMSKESWRQAIALSILQPNSRFGQQYAETERFLRAQLADYFVAMSDNGQLKPMESPAALGEILFNTLSAMFQLFLVTDAMTIDELETILARQTSAILDMLVSDGPDPRH